jgi:hypothetical protein
MINQMILWAAHIEQTPEGGLIRATCWFTRLLLIAVSALIWLNEVGTGRVRCWRCGFWMRQEPHIEAYTCLICGACQSVYAREWAE